MTQGHRLASIREQQARDNTLHRILQTMQRNGITFEELREFNHRQSQTTELTANQMIQRSRHVANRKSSNQSGQRTTTSKQNGRQSVSLRAESVAK